MSYWGSLPEDNDFAFGRIGVTILQIKRKMFEDAALVKEKQYPEQSIISSLVCLRLLGERFPNCLNVHFGNKTLEEAKELFYEWYERCGSKIPSKYRAELSAEAKSEFELFRIHLNSPNKN